MPENEAEQQSEIPLLHLEVNEVDWMGWAAFALMLYGLTRVFQGGKNGKSGLVRR